jgi:hypothetical protein
VGRASSGAIPHRMKWRQRGEQGAARCSNGSLLE